MLALFALFTSIEEVFYRVSDEAVARAKLSWWTEQLLGPEYATSTHPVIRQLHRSRAIAPAARDALVNMLRISLERLGAPSPANEDELKSLSLGIGQFPMQLELALCAGSGWGEVPAAVCAVNGLVQLLRESSRKLDQSYYWIPLNLLARHRLSRNELNADGKSLPASQLMEKICRLGESWLASDQTRAGASAPAGRAWAAWPKHPLYRHCYIQSEMNLRMLGRLRHMQLQQHKQVFDSANLSDAWSAWRCALRTTEKGRLK